MDITVSLSDDQSKRLVQLAKSLSIDPNELASAAVSDLLSRPDDDFERLASRVLSKNQELYDRLS
ncbi:MAG: DNA-binding protein [Planctomycetes bacterium]|nr:DNA-binding protein [Planctomycetota bacterium]